MTDEAEPIDVQLALDEAEVRIGEVMDSTGATEPQVWVTGRGRRQHAQNEPVDVHLFMSIEESKGLGVELIGQGAVLEEMLKQPEFPPESEPT